MLLLLVLLILLFAGGVVWIHPLFVLALIVLVIYGVSGRHTGRWY